MGLRSVCADELPRSIVDPLTSSTVGTYRPRGSRHERQLRHTQDVGRRECGSVRRSARTYRHPRAVHRATVRPFQRLPEI